MDSEQQPTALETSVPQKLMALLGTSAESIGEDRGHIVVTTDTAQLFPLLQKLKDEATVKCDFLVDITVVDWMDKRSRRFEVVYHLLSIEFKTRIRVKVAVEEDAAQVKSVVPLWAGANFMEREAWDMYGIKFEGHPDLRRILLYDEFKGHPLRKDYPVQLKQPRIPLRYPEVENTARRMARPDLVAITKRNVN